MKLVMVAMMIVTKLRVTKFWDADEPTLHFCPTSPNLVSAHVVMLGADAVYTKTKWWGWPAT